MYIAGYYFVSLYFIIDWHENLSRITRFQCTRVRFTQRLANMVCMVSLNKNHSIFDLKGNGYSCKGFKS